MADIWLPGKERRFRFRPSPAREGPENFRNTDEGIGCSKSRHLDRILTPRGPIVLIKVPSIRGYIFSILETCRILDDKLVKGRRSCAIFMRGNDTVAEHACHLRREASYIALLWNFSFWSGTLVVWCTMCGRHIVCKRSGRYRRAANGPISEQWFVHILHGRAD